VSVPTLSSSSANIAATGGPSDGESRSIFERIMRPKSVAIVGMSPRANTTSSAVFRNLRLNAFAGDIHLVGRTAAEVDGVPIRTSMDDLPNGIDVAVLALPAAGIAEAIAECVAHKIGAAVVFASGFAEAGGRAEQDRIADVAARGGLAVIGPNCIGYTNYRDGFTIAFANVYTIPPLPAATTDAVAIVAQSGGLAGHLRLGLQARGVAVSYSISTGNEMGLGLGDFARFLLADEATRVILAYAEDIRQPALFLEAAHRARDAGKAVVLMHSGRGARAQAAAQSHTGALAADYGVMRAQVERAGVVLVETLDELMDVSEILARYPTPKPGGLGVLTLSGAYCGIAHDFCEERGIPVPPLSPATAQHLAPQMPPFIAPDNPLDLGTQPIWQPELLQIGLAALLSDAAFAGVAISIPAGAAPQANSFLKNVIAGQRGNTKPLTLAMHGDSTPLPDDFIATAREHKLVLSRSSDRSLRALGKVITWANQPHAPALNAVAAFPHMPSLGAGPQPEWLGKRALAAAGIAVPPGWLATTLEDAVAAAAEIGYPVAMKAQAAELTHKTEAGGVLLGVADAGAVRAAWATLQANVERAQPGLRLDGVLVEAMSPRGLELVAGARRDPKWGAIIIVGLGGIFVEALQDVRLVAADATKEQVLAELNELKGAKLLHGFRGRPAVDVDAVADVAVALGRLIRSQPEIVEIDVNPLMAYARGEGATALDALVVTAQETQSRP
jgi:acyl-CoA synthetase (NDP forming)